MTSSFSLVQVKSDGCKFNFHPSSLHSSMYQTALLKAIISQKKSKCSISSQETDLTRWKKEKVLRIHVTCCGMRLKR